MLLRLRFALFVGVVGAVTLLGHWYVWTRLARDTALPAPLAAILGGLLLLLWALMVGAIPLSHLLPARLAAPVARVGTTWLGVSFLLLITLGLAGVAFEILPLAAPHLAARWGMAPGPTGTITFPGSPPLVDAYEIYRARLAAGAALLLTAGLVGLGVRSATGTVPLRSVSVRIPGLPAELSGLTIVQLSDVHLGLNRGHFFLAEIVDQVSALAPDLVVLTGDIIDGPPELLREAVAPLKELAPPLGVYYVTGNHEYQWDADACVELLRGVGVRPLRNQRVELTRAGGAATLTLAGIDDLTGRWQGFGQGANFEAALGGRDPNRPVILLAHQPKAVTEAARRGVDLMLSGHTHGGQIFPLHWLVTLEQPFLEGLGHKGATQVYVSRGTGYWGPPLRLGAPPEVTLLTLT